MSAIDLPITADSPYFGFSTEIDSASYLFTFRWNGRDGSWFMDVADGDGDVIVTGVKVVLGTFLGANLRNVRMPPGLFTVIDTSGRDIEATFADFGKRVVVFYASAYEFA